MTRGLNAPLRAVCERIRALLFKATADEVKTRYCAGQLLLKLKRAPDTYGSNAVGQLAAELGCEAATLYRYALVPERWPLSEMKVLVARTTPKGCRLSWSHWVELARVESSELRAKLLARVLREGLSVRELVHAVAAEERASKKASRAASLHDALVSLTAQVERLSAQVSGELGELFDGDAIVSDRRGDLDALLSRAIDAHAGLCERAGARVEELTRIRQRIAKEVSVSRPGRSAGGSHGLLLAGGRDVRVRAVPPSAKAELSSGQREAQASRAWDTLRSRDSRGTRTTVVF
jgi:hypothetical protein